MSLCRMEGTTPPRQRAAELYRTYGPAVYRRCLGLLRDREAAKDATHDVFMKLVRDLAKNDDAAIVLPWIYRVATNHCLNVLRHRAWHGESELGDQELASGAADPALDERNLARTVLSQFDEATQAVAVGVLVEGMGHEELGATLGMSRSTVERRLTRFLDHARKFLSGDAGAAR